MKVSIHSPSPLNAKNIRAGDGGIEFEPLFFSPKAAVEGPFIEVTNSDGESVFRGVLKISGATGSVSVVGRQQPVLPEIESQVREQSMGGQDIATAGDTYGK